MPEDPVFAKTKRSFSVIENERFGLVFAKIYRPSFRENKPKTIVFSNRKRAFWARFHENWVYEFGHWSLPLYNSVVLGCNSWSTNCGEKMRENAQSCTAHRKTFDCPPVGSSVCKQGYTLPVQRRILYSKDYSCWALVKLLSDSILACLE